LWARLTMRSVASTTAMPQQRRTGARAHQQRDGAYAGCAQPGTHAGEPVGGHPGRVRGQKRRLGRRGAVIVYVDEAANVSVPTTVNGVRTMVIPTTARAVALGSAPQSSFEMSAIPGLQGPCSPGGCGQQQTAQALMQQNPAFFGVGVGQSLDNPKEAALVIFVDRRNIPAELAANGQRPAHTLRRHGPVARHAILRGEAPNAKPLRLAGAKRSRQASMD